jgi:hypothetical protein
MEGLHKAKDPDFAHDVIGIIKNLNYKSGKLENLFCPRYAK